MSKKESVFNFFSSVPVKIEGDILVYQCKCGVQRKQKKKSGYSNLLSHIHSSHNDNASSSSQPKMEFFYSNKAKNIFSCIDWIVSENREFQFCEKELVRKYSKLEPISCNSLMKYIDLLVKNVELKIKNSLPSKFGLVLDGWTDKSTHYIAVFAIFPSDSNRREILLAFSPLLDESDLTADSVRSFLKFILENVYGKGLSNVTFLVADNATVNKRLADLLNIPLIGCFSHKLHLAIKLLLSQNEKTVSNVREVMKKLRGLKRSAVLRRQTNLSPLLDNETRWSSAYWMLKRYFELLPFMDESDVELCDLLPSPSENASLKSLLEKLNQFESVAQILQKSETNLSTARLIFNEIVIEFPELGKYLSADAQIVHSKGFESALHKVVQNQEIDEGERQIVDVFETMPTDFSSDDSFISRALKRQKMNPVMRDILQLIPATSNIVERLFSQAKLIKTDQRNMSPVVLESTVFLKVNHMFWNEASVDECINKC